MGEAFGVVGEVSVNDLPQKLLFLQEEQQSFLPLNIAEIILFFPFLQDGAAAGDSRLQYFRVRLRLQQVDGAGVLIGLVDVVEYLVGGEKDDPAVRPLAVQLTCDLQAAHLGHVDVQKGDVNVGGGHDL